MEKLSGLGRGIEEIAAPTFAAYEPLLKAQESSIRSTRRETHSYGPDPRHVLDVYFPDQSLASSKPKKVLVFLYGGGFYSGARVNEGYAGGLIFCNIGRFFTARFGVTVVVPDYRLLSHGAKYPSGGEDVSFVVEWLKTSLAGRDGYESIDLFFLGNSAGGVHVATYLVDPVFEAAREALLTGGEVRLRGAIFLGAPFHWGESRHETLRAYLGDDTVFENSTIGKLKEVNERGEASRLPKVKILVLISELDPQLMFDTAEELKQVWEGADIEIQVLEGHNHLSPQLSLGTGVEREEAWGVQVAEFISSCASD
ncbi:Alpha/Beta hydrolase protein [Xylaria sp. FL0933]|nr:Alpha/Beta hydrolase protein [Xylaria sp. FL0933]